MLPNNFCDLQASQVIPGQVTFTDSCTDMPYTTYESYYETVQEESKYTTNDCQTISDPQCHNYNTPTYQVENVTQTEVAQIQVDECEITTVEDQVCLFVLKAANLFRFYFSLILLLQGPTRSIQTGFKIPVRTGL